ncbi:hypothetical protein NLG97_g2758 [Lecanicillium saksenae]|uniref:Uncharacterized protein n=1 Tax=Lecanicillium saksenae TaxID=468837 RepID=A0ACC1R1F0_9HYPO|nr:hypothetical protein NLG97_g2758 [Lecanicillium saksenae]
MASSNDPSLRLALDLQLRDVAELQPKKNGRGRKRKATDFEIALGVYAEQLASDIQPLGGRLAAPLDAVRPRKRAATTKSVTATPSVRAILPREAKSAALLSMQMQLAARQPEQEEQQASASDPTSTLLATGNELQCAGCFEPPHDGHVSVCEHIYCPTCVSTLFANATNNESMFPPGCCGNAIPLEDARDLLSDELIARFERKQIEFNTPNRRYCHHPNCGEFLAPADFDGDRCQCTACQYWTCILCRAAAHNGVCPNDPVQNQLAGAEATFATGAAFSCANADVSSRNDSSAAKPAEAKKYTGHNIF